MMSFRTPICPLQCCPFGSESKGAPVSNPLHWTRPRSLVVAELVIDVVAVDVPVEVADVVTVDVAVVVPHALHIAGQKSVTFLPRVIVPHVPLVNTVAHEDGSDVPAHTGTTVDVAVELTVCVADEVADVVLLAEAVELALVVTEVVALPDCELDGDEVAVLVSVADLVVEADVVAEDVIVEEGVGVHPQCAGQWSPRVSPDASKEMEHESLLTITL